MKIVRWLLSHIFLIMLIVVVIYGYMFWGKLTDADTPGGKAVAYLSNKFVSVEEFVNETRAKQAKLSDKPSIEGNELEGEEQAGEEQAGEEQAGSQQNVVTDMDAASEDAASEKAADNIESSIIDRRSEFSVNDTQITIDDTFASESAVDVNKDTFVSPDVETQLNSVDIAESTVDTSNTQPLRNQQGDVSINDERFTIDDATDDAVEISKDTFVSPDIEAQLNGDGATVDTSNAQPLTNQQSDVSVNDEPITIGDAVASAGASAIEIAKDFFVSPEVEEKLKNADAGDDVGDDTEEVVTASRKNTNEQDIDVKASWITARKSYHQRNYELSEKSYQQVIDSTEDNYDAYGELGNVYFNQKKNIQAASAYYEAAAIFVRIGQSSRAKSLIGLLWRLDPSKADELQKLIDSASS